MFTFFNGAVMHEYHKKLVALGGYATWDTQFAGGGGGGESYSSGETQGTLLYTLTNPDTQGDTYDYFGGSEMEFSPSGQYLAVGAMFDDSASNSGIGAVHLYDMTDGSKVWTVEGSHADERLGDRIDVTDNYVFVSHQRYDYNGGNNVGRVTVYDITDGSLHATINPPLNWSNLYFGLFIAINPSTEQLAIYEAYNDRITIRSSSDYTSIDTTITSVTGSAGFSEGAMDGTADYFVIGHSNSEVVKVYNWSGTLQQTYTDPGSHYKWGYNVALSGDYLAVADPGYTDGNDGRVKVYNTSNWGLAYNKDYFTVSSQFSWNTDITNEHLLVTEPYNNYGGQLNSGKAYLLDATDGSTLQTHVPPTATRNGYYGWSGALDTYRYAIGEQGTNKIYVFSTGN